MIDSFVQVFVRIGCGIYGVTVVMAILSLAGCGSGSSSPSVELVAHYPMDGQAIDVVGGYDGVLNGTTPAVDRNSGVDSALLLDGQSDYVEVPSPAFLDNLNSFTVTVWVNPDATYGQLENGHIDIVSRWGLGGANGASLLIGVDASGAVLAAVSDGTQSTWLSSGVNLPVNIWNFLAVTRDDRALTIYLNGVAIAEALGPVAMQSSSYALDFGREPVGGNYFSGVIDDIRFYSGAMTFAQLEAVRSE